MPKKKPIDAETLWRIPRVGVPSPAPDGRRVAVPVTTYEEGAEEGTTRIWLLPSDARGAGDGGREDPARPWTTAEASSGRPAWSPDGTRIAFLRKPQARADGAAQKAGRGAIHADVGQLHVLALEGGEAERLTDLPFGAGDPRWFPDGRRIAFVSEVYEAAPDLPATAVRKKAREDDPVKAHVTEERWYRYWDKWLTEKRFLHLFVLDLETRELVDLTPRLFRLLSLMETSDVFEISPDGREIAFTAIKSDPPYDDLLQGVFVVKVPRTLRAGTKPPRIREITRGHPGDAHHPTYSPDGCWLVYGKQYEPDFYADRVRLVLRERQSGRERVLTEAWDASAETWAFGGDPATLYLKAEVDARSAFFRLDLEAALEDPEGNPPVEIARGGTFAGLEVAGGRIFATLSSLTAPPEAVVVEPDGSSVHALTAFTRPALRHVALGRMEEVRFPGAGDDLVQMFLVLPPGAQRPRKKAKKDETRWPLVHLIHGGPHGTFGDVWHWRWNAQTFAAPGYAVACVNFHGSTSFGDAFTRSILGRWGDQPLEDVLKATDVLLERGLVKRRKMAVAGGSYGGYLVSWIASQSDRFACAVNHAGVCDFQTQYASDVTHGRARSMGGEPWDDQAGMDRYNPMRHAKGFGPPMLVVHGAKDYRVPADQALEIYGVYKARRLPARLVVYPDENHWILKPHNSRHWYGEVLGWLARWLG